MDARAIRMGVMGMVVAGGIGIARGEGPGETASARAGRLAEGLRKAPVVRPHGTYQYRLFLMELATGKVTVAVDEPEQGRTYLGSPSWTADGRRIYFDATPMTLWNLTHIKAIELDGEAPRVVDLGLGNGPTASRDGKSVAFLSNADDVERGLYVMKPDGTGRRRLGNYGRPKWAPAGDRLLICSFGSPTQLSLLNVGDGTGAEVSLPDVKVFGVPNWVDAKTIVASVGAGETADAIALVDVLKPEVGKVLWKRGEMDVVPADVIHDAETGRCVFVGAEAKGVALYSFVAGKGEAPRRLEDGPLDHEMSDLALSPDGKFLIFKSDRGDRGRR